MFNDIDINYDRLVKNINKKLHPRTCIRKDSLKLINIVNKNDYIAVVTFEATTMANDVIKVEKYILSTIDVIIMEHQNKLYAEFRELIHNTIKELINNTNKKFGKSEEETKQVLQEIINKTINQAKIIQT
jgi:hypothetical protein